MAECMRCGAGAEWLKGNPPRTSVADLLREAARVIEQESNLYRDGDKYQPHGRSLRKVSAKLRRAAGGLTA